MFGVTIGLGAITILIGTILGIISNHAKLPPQFSQKYIWTLIGICVAIEIMAGFAIAIVTEISSSDTHAGDRRQGSETLSTQPKHTAGPQDVPPTQWKILVQQPFNLPNGPATQRQSFGCSDDSGSFEGGRLVLRIDTCRDHTYQVGYEPQPHQVGADYYLTADVQYVSGPVDGYCVFLFGIRDSEHWYAFKVNRDSFEITRDKGVLPHQVLDGPRTDPAINVGKTNRLSVLMEEGKGSFYINGAKVSDQEILAPDGITNVGVQAAKWSDVARCGFDNVELRG